MKTVLIIAALLLVCGCSTTQEYTAYTQAHAQAETAKYRAMSDVASTGGEGAKVAVVMAMAMGQNQSTLRAPEAPGGTALQWLSVLMPTVVQAYGITANMQLGMRQSDNGASVARSTNDTMNGIAKLIQAPITITNTDRHDTVTPAPVISPPVVITPPAPVIITPPAPVIITPIVSGK